ncbi:hypothetical protein SISNIDRAFT_469213 [Sistotremastrum niveocremeum HHB9708]|uniref:Uncharacterized protein n=1 Tax=Sistotremastrum niveocremeum HHB9708 TaxID=1314777 RepID=A0A164QJE7_9AGAM|nr:hypothetical protein SISNIDRAFT_471702 [Sistotremastrum niveocremeum HHB9708]KZS89713.1 hypothetical protein SISNIDRAFT_469213 [Sistotremastrum niveocremeum HHB9708]
MHTLESGPVSTYAFSGGLIQGETEQRETVKYDLIEPRNKTRSRNAQLKSKAKASYGSVRLRHDTRAYFQRDHVHFLNLLYDATGYLDVRIESFYLSFLDWLNRKAQGVSVFCQVVGDGKALSATGRTMTGCSPFLFIVQALNGWYILFKATTGAEVITEDNGQSLYMFFESSIVITL